jgi:hypothetical protein
LEESIKRPLGQGIQHHELSINNSPVKHSIHWLWLEELWVLQEEYSIIILK